MSLIIPLLSNILSSLFSPSSLQKDSINEKSKNQVKEINRKDNYNEINSGEHKISSSLKNENILCDYNELSNKFIDINNTSAVYPDSTIIREKNVIQIFLNPEQKKQIADLKNLQNLPSKEIAKIYRTTTARINLIAKNSRNGKQFSDRPGRPSVFDSQSLEIINTRVKEARQSCIEESKFSKCLKNILREEYCNAYIRLHKLDHLSNVSIASLTKHIGSRTLRRYYNFYMKPNNYEISASSY